MDTTTPTPQPETPAPTTAPETVPPVTPAPETLPPSPAATPSPYIATAPAKKKSLLWLWITLPIVLLLIIIGLVVGYFVAKGNVETVSREYNVELQKYLETVRDAADGNVTDVEDIEKDVEKAKKPELKEPFLASLSDTYKESKELSEESTKAVDDLKGKLKSYVTTIEFYNRIKEMDDKIKDAVSSSQLTSANAVSRFEEIQDILEEYIDELKKTDGLPEEAKEAAEGMTEVYEDAADIWEDLTAALKSKNRSAYQSALTKYNANSSKISKFSRQLESFKSGLSSDLRDDAEVINELADKVEEKTKDEE